MKKTHDTKAQLDKLNAEEEKLMPIITKVFLRTNKNKPIYSKELVQGIIERKIKLDIKRFSEARLRKIVNHMRVNAILPIISTSNGYYLSYEPEDILMMIRSLMSRANAITAAADGMMNILNNIRLIDQANKSQDLWDMVDDEIDKLKK
jgi:hypothetical protein